MASGGPGTVNLGLNVGSYLSGINSVINSTQTYNQTVNQLNVTLNQMQASSGRATAGLGGVNAQLGLLTTVAAAQAVAGLARQFEAATREAAEFSRSIGLIQTIAQDSGLSYAEWAQGIREVSDALALPIADVAAGAYNALSNQVVKGAESFEFLSTAGKLALVTNGSVQDSINALSNALNSYGGSAADAERISAQFFSLIDLGRVKISDLANTSGRLYETGKALGISLEETNAALAAVTQSGVRSNTAMTLLQNLFSQLTKPTEELAKLYRDLGVASGDIAVKTYTLPGLLIKLQEATKGSAAETAKLLADIRGNQAYTILTDRVDAFTQALKEQNNALDRSKAALAAYESTPGFKFQKDVNELRNEIVTGFKTSMLELATDFSERIGGLKNGVYTLFGVTESLAKRYSEVARQGAADDAKMRSQDVADAKASLDRKSRDVLTFAANARKALSTIGNGLDESGAKISARVRNSVELVLSSARESVRDIESRLSKALSNVSAARQARVDNAANRGDALYNYRLAADQANTGGANERAIMQRRLDELEAQKARAKKAGDLDRYNRAADRQESILNQAATATDAYGNLRYNGQGRALAGFYAGRDRDTQYIGAVNAGKAGDLTKQQAEITAQFKTLEDAGRALYSLSVVDKKGNPLFGSRSQFEGKASGLMADFTKSLEAIRANPNVTMGDRTALMAQQSLMTQRMRDLRADYGELVKNQGERQGNLDLGTRVESAVNSLSKVMKDAADKIAKAVGEADSLGLRAAESRANAKGIVSDLGSAKALAGTETSDFVARRDRLVASINDAIDRGETDKAQAALGELSKWFEARGASQQNVMATGPYATPQEALGAARTAIFAAGEAGSQSTAANVNAAALTNAPEALGDALKRLNEAVDPAKVETAVGSLERLVGGLEAALSKAEGLSRGKGETAASHSMGGFAGYFAAGGEPRGIDTALVRMSPDEIIMSPQASARFRSQLTAMNAGVSPFGSVTHGDTHYGDVTVHVNGAGHNPSDVADEVISRIQRGRRLGTLKL
jgi:TP901 family phage tail tape measure protein